MTQEDPGVMRIINEAGVVKPSLYRLVDGFQVKLFDIFLSLRATPSPLPLGEKTTARDRADRIATWQTKAAQAFEQVLDLRLMMEQSVCPYSFRWAELEDKFDKSWMASAHEDYQPPDQGTPVLVSLRPAIYNCSRRKRAEPSLIIPALVMLEGFGASDRCKVDSGAIRAIPRS
ncbi:hypothetical protein A1O1_07299 [Capronia coronata CBS 617.96]|uniref:Uncharacterized protein n=1 Tax=Capronia coronata CBS 617.96 TaxID=1182541 RepID=W9Y203_9EURO|nr:uncharacterized protein A1O1_07299 [Capronia coronata CBS 617.96]EXJ83675.1 hypothetical protein A1O1_07299 [Capronia coronata CBS 617.96]